MSLFKAFQKLKPFRVLVLGDFLLDTYTTGSVKRISPEAPVPVMEVFRKETRPGGAGNVILNLAELGAEVACVGRVGSDDEGKLLRKTLASPQVDVDLLLDEQGYITPVKNRLIAGSQQLMRIDREVIAPLDPSLEQKLIQLLETKIANVDVIALSDYGKGFLTDTLIQAVIKLSRKKDVPVIVDPKGIDFSKYKGATLIKPNLSEAYAAAKKTTLDEAADEIFSIADPQNLLITRSEAGMSLFSSKAPRQDFPVVSKEVKDVTGAGDTVLAILCLGMANHLDMPQTLRLANIAAGFVIERVGCVQISLPELAERLLQADSQTKVLDGHEQHALELVLKNKGYLLFVFSGNSFAFLKELQSITENIEQKVIAYARDAEEDTLHFLSSISEIDGILLQEKNLSSLMKKTSPKEVFVWEENRFARDKRAKDLLHDLLSQSLV